MRALCGAIIAAGALLGLGLLSIGAGLRYATFPYHDGAGAVQFVRLRDVDTLLMTSFVILVIALFVGLGIAFVGLAYHHHRRHLELTRTHQGPPGAPTATTTTTERVSA
jgi:hypothetical protein